MTTNSLTESTPAVNLPIIRLQRDGDRFYLVFPVEQRYRVKMYQKRSSRRPYSMVEPIFTPYPIVELTREQAQAIAKALTDGHVHSYEHNELWFYADAGELLAGLANDQTHVSDGYPYLPADDEPDYSNEHPDYLRLEAADVM